MSRLPQADEHDQFTQIIGKCIQAPDSKMKIFILISLDEEGQPYVTGNTDTPGDAMYILQCMVENGLDGVTVNKLDLPKDN